MKTSRIPKQSVLALSVILFFTLNAKAQLSTKTTGNVSFEAQTDVAAGLVSLHLSTMSAPPPVAQILDPGVEISKRLRAVYSLGYELEDGEISDLCIFLKSHAAAGEVNPEGIRALKNEIMNTLRHQVKLPQQLTSILIEIYDDAAQEEVIRDYAVQHLGFWHEQGAARMPGQQASIRTSLEKATHDNSSIAGTALLAMHQLSTRESQMNGKLIDSVALALASSPQTHFASRITAIQICSERRLMEVLPYAQTLAGGSNNVALRLSSIAALGHLGHAAQLSDLQKLEDDPHDLVRAAIRKSIDELKHRLEHF